MSNAAASVVPLQQAAKIRHAGFMSHLWASGADDILLLVEALRSWAAVR